ESRRPRGRARGDGPARHCGRALRAGAGARCRHERVPAACRSLRTNGASGRGRGDASEARADRATRNRRRRAVHPRARSVRRVRSWAASTAIVLAVGVLSGADAPSSQFVDVTVKANVAFTNINGASPDKHLPETMGSGGAFVDLDSDGWVDIVLVDGGSIAD